MNRDEIEVDVLFVGAGPACLAGALHLARLHRDHTADVTAGRRDGPPLDPLTILVIEKGKRIGSHILSGAVVDPRAFDELLEGLTDEQPPYDCPVGDDALYFLTSKNAFRSPITPPPLQNHGYQVASLGKLVVWMAELCERNEIEVYPEFPAVELLFEGSQVVGVRIGDKGRDRNGQPKSNFEPGIDVRAKVTVLGEGPRGTLARQAFQRLGLRRNTQPQLYAVGVKEIWKLERELEPGQVFHTLGFPLGTQEFGGGFIYTMRGNLINLGFVTGLDYKNPQIDPHRLFEQFKTHPWVRQLLDRGEAVSYGAKTIPEGGYYALPRFYADGLLVVGDSAGFLNSQRLKGIHLAVKSGMLAAETIVEALTTGDFTTRILAAYRQRFEKSWMGRELWKVRNFRQGFQRGFWRGFLHGGLQHLSNGRGLIDPLLSQPGHSCMQTLQDHFGETEVPAVADEKVTLAKLDDVFLSDTVHEEDQPSHLKVADFDICHNRCTQEYGNPCQHFCPAAVYEMVADESQPRGARLQINFTNCVHCKTCDIMDPYQIINWTPPEGGGGPDYGSM